MEKFLNDLLKDMVPDEEIVQRLLAPTLKPDDERSDGEVDIGPDTTRARPPKPGTSYADTVKTGDKKDQRDKSSKSKPKPRGSSSTTDAEPAKTDDRDDKKSKSKLSKRRSTSPAGNQPKKSSEERRTDPDRDGKPTKEKGGCQDFQGGRSTTPPRNKRDQQGCKQSSTSKVERSPPQISPQERDALAMVVKMIQRQGTSQLPKK